MQIKTIGTISVIIKSKPATIIQALAQKANGRYFKKSTLLIVMNFLKV